ncbi:MAG: helicase C-terminal domain-containing protein [Fusobacterium sp. JB021]|nr:helicase C-terminal domain-containing protein [Fusobacterium sp. JB021]MDP0507679.1 helicase C-terminal domain-containing protein [Fusobacterium sp. JB019]
MKIEEVIDLESRKKLKKEIENSGENEVFFKGILDENRVVSEVVPLARGNKYSVPAFLKRMKRNEVIIHNHPSGYLYPSDADIEVANIFGNKKDGGFYIINNKVDDVYVVMESFSKENKKIDVLPYFEEKGLISQKFKEFEFRKEQNDMVQHIQEGLNKEKKIIVEAGTGTGKTLAYLIPSIEWALENEKKVVISTNTINLQEQLINKDIPMIRKIMDKKFKYILVKGRGNYLCNRKYYNVSSGNIIKPANISEEQKVQVKKLINWGRVTQTGDKSELSFEPSYDIWEYFQSESDTCYNGCPHREECFFFKARDEKKNADILIANHHIFFSDLAIKKEIGFNTDFSILPEYGLVVFDEAHNIEKVARDYFSYEVSKYSFVKSMNKIYNLRKEKLLEGKEGKYKLNSHLEVLWKYLKKIDIENKSKIEKIICNDLIEKHKNLFLAGDIFFKRIIEIFSKGQNGSLSIRIKKGDMLETNFLKMLEKEKQDFVLEFNTYLNLIKRLLSLVSEAEDKEGKISEFVNYTNRLESFLANFNFINTFEDEEFIYWIEVNEKKNNSKLVATPLKVDNELSENLYENLKQIIFTSATIAIVKNFKYFKESIGLQEETYDKIIASPFDYDKQMKVYLPEGISAPNDRNFLDDVQNLLEKLIIKSKGRTFVLFTSYRALNYVYYSIRKELEKNGIELFIQGMYPRTKLVELYKKSNYPVLFGTDSFWEGVDVKGDKLSSVVIVKLPFKVPNDPITEAIIEKYEEQGKNSFLEYQIPESVIKFKQGIGRLIRSKEDRGVVTILDNRVITKRYGKYFLQSIPTRNIIKKDVKEIIR